LLAELVPAKPLFRERDRILGHREHWKWMSLSLGENRLTAVSGGDLEGNLLARAHIAMSETGW